MLKCFKVAVFLSLVVFFISCKESVETQAISKDNLESPDVIKEKRLKIEIDYVSSKPDNFRVILNNIKMDNQKLNITINQAVVESKEIQNLVFKIPFDGKPRSISFGLGNKEVKEFSFKKIHLTYDENSFTISEDQIEKYFNYNKFVFYDASSNSLVTKKINNSHSPVITLKPIVKNSIYK